MRCKKCHMNLTREVQRRERYRLYQLGYQRKQVNDVMPLCSLHMDGWIYKHHTKFSQEKLS